MKKSNTEVFLPHIIFSVIIILIVIVIPKTLVNNPFNTSFAITLADILILVALFIANMAMIAAYKLLK